MQAEQPRTRTPVTAAPVAGGMPGGGAGAPPMVLPVEHFAAGLLFLVCGAFGLVWVAPQLAGGFYLMPQVAGVTHLFTLGWLTTSIMGALYQLLPVVLSQPIRSVRLAHLTFALYASGLAAFVVGLLLPASGVMLAGATVFATGVVLFLVNAGRTLAVAPQRGVTWWALALALAFLFLTLVFGVTLAANLRWGFLGGGRLDALGTHLHVALAGWVLLVVIGVGQRLLPMFLLTHGVSDRLGRLAVVLVGSGAGALALLHHAPPLISRWLPLALIAAGLASFLVQARQFFARRVRPRLDAGMRLAAAGLVLLGVGLVLAPVVIAGIASARLAVAYVLALVLGLSLFVAGHYYKIVPFLVWYHRFGPLAGRQPVPRVNELYGVRASNVAALLLALGAFGLVAGTGFGSAAAVRAAALLFAAGACTEAAQMVSILGRKP